MIVSWVSSPHTVLVTYVPALGAGPGKKQRRGGNLKVNFNKIKMKFTAYLKSPLLGFTPDLKKLFKL